MKGAQGNDKTAKRHVITSAISVAVAMIKLIAGAVSLSVTVIFSGFCTLLLTAGKAVCRIGERNPSFRPYYAVAALQALAALLYGAAAVRAYYFPPGFAFGLVPAILIAAAAFYELGSATVGSVRAARQKNGVRLTLKTIYLSGAFNALALTQTALLSVGGGSVTSASSAMSFITAAVTAVCAAVTLRSGLKSRGEEETETEPQDERE